MTRFEAAGNVIEETCLHDLIGLLENLGSGLPVAIGLRVTYARTLQKLKKLYVLHLYYDVLISQKTDLKSQMFPRYS